MPKSKWINFSVNNTLQCKTAKYKVVVYQDKLEQPNIVFNNSLHPLTLLTASVDIFQIKIYFGSCCPDNGSKLRPVWERIQDSFWRIGRWPLVHIHVIDTSQTLFYFVPQEKGLIRRPPSWAWKIMGESIFDPVTNQIWPKYPKIDGYTCSGRRWTILGQDSSWHPSCCC